MKDTAIKVLIADNQLLTRTGLQTIIDAQPNMSVVGMASAGKELFEKNRALRPDVVIIDYHYSGTFSIDDLKALNESESTELMVITSDTSKSNIYEVMELGVRSFLTKKCDDEEIINGIEACLNKEKFICAQVLDILFPKEKVEEGDCDATRLTQREEEIVGYVARGLTTKQIAQKLYLSPHTINTHRKNILKKLGLESTSHLVLYAINTGIIRLD